MYKEKFLDIISHDPELNEIFKILERMHLPEATICGGTIRNLIWNKQTGHHSSLKLGDIDVYYKNSSQSYENFLMTKEILAQNHSLYLWNIKNICLPARHLSHRRFYDSIEKTIADFPETATSVGVQKSRLNGYHVIAPYGLADLFELQVSPTPNYAVGQAGHQRYQQRLTNKAWQARWPELTIND